MTQTAHKTHSCLLPASTVPKRHQAQLNPTGRQAICLQSSSQPRTFLYLHSSCRPWWDKEEEWELEVSVEDWLKKTTKN